MTFREVLLQRLHHDLGFGFYIKEGTPTATFRIIAKSRGILCGMIFVPTIVELVDKEFFLKPLSPCIFDEIETYAYAHDGDRIEKGEVIAEIQGNSEVLLKAERTVCNIISELSGIATYTRKKVGKLAGLAVDLLDTRKDDALMREMHKYAVSKGGAKMHRAGFYDGMLIKDNDIAVYGGVKNAIDRRVKETKFLTRVEIEVDGLEGLEEVLADGRVDVILLDNMNPALLRKAVRRIREEKKPYLIEASGIGALGIRKVAKTGVTHISLSALVRKADPLDISMKVIEAN